MIYPNSKIKVTLFIDGDAGMLDFKIYWFGHHKAMKYKASEIVFYEDFPVEEGRQLKKLKLIPQQFMY